MYALDSYEDLSGEVGGVAVSSNPGKARAAIMDSMLSVRVQNCVAGVIEAFENGAVILKRMKERRAAKNEMPLPRILEESITEAPGEIEREQLRGIVRFGSQFEVGDVTAVLALQKITIQLQNSLLNKLRDVEDGDADVMALARAADSGRDNTITTLISLRRRLGDAELTRMTSAASTMSISSPAQPSNPAASPPSMYWPPEPPARPSLTSPLRVAPPPVPQPTYDRPSMTFSPSSYGSRTEIPSYFHREMTDGQLTPQSSASSSRGDPGRNSSIYSPDPRPASFSSAAAAPISPHDTHARTLSADSVPTTAAAAQQPYTLNFTARNQHPTRDNNYLGFCKSAWKLQCGDNKAMTKAKDFTQSAQSKYHYLVCSKARCDFKGRGPRVLTNSVVTDVPRGIKYRWTFLAKSHVFVKSAQNEEFSYLCMFCVFAGQQAVVMNLAALLDHISQRHRGGLGEVLLDRTCCVQGRVCKDGEKFDINILPEGEEGGRRGSGRDSGVFRPFAEMSGEREVVELSGRKRSEVSERVFELYNAGSGQ